METHFPNLAREKSVKKSVNFKQMHRIIMIFKACLRGIYHAVIYLQSNVNQCTFLYNRYKMKELIFEKLMQRMGAKPLYSYRSLISKGLIQCFYNLFDLFFGKNFNRSVFRDLSIGFPDLLMKAVEVRKASSWLGIWKYV